MTNDRAHGRLSPIALLFWPLFANGDLVDRYDGYDLRPSQLGVRLTWISSVAVWLAFYAILIAWMSGLFLIHTIMIGPPLPNLAFLIRFATHGSTPYLVGGMALLFFGWRSVCRISYHVVHAFAYLLADKQQI